MNVKNNNRKHDTKPGDVDNRGENISGESNVTKQFDAILEDIKNNGKTAKSISVNNQGGNINLHTLIMKLLNAEETLLKKDHGFDEVFNILNEMDNKRNKRNEYKPITSNNITKKIKCWHILKF